MKKLSDYAREHRVTYRTAWNRFKQGKIPGAHMDETGHVVIAEPEPAAPGRNVAIYARVANPENRAHLDAQVERLKEYAIRRGYCIVRITKETGSGVNDHRPRLLKLLQEPDWSILLVEHKDRLTRFAFSLIETLLVAQGRRVEVVNQAEDDRADLVDDLVAVIYSFGARLYGLRRTKRKTQQLLACLEEES
jgi:predicted site-specific integrase-resolvase